MPTISAFEVTDRHLEVSWNDGAVSRYPWIWLRDHDHSPATMHPTTRQRLLYTAGVADNLRPSAVRLCGGDVVIEWPHDPASTLPVEFLAAYRAPATPAAVATVRPVPWDAASLGDHPTVPYAEVMAGDAGVVRWLTAVAATGFCIATGTPPTADATEALARQVSYVRETIFGGFWEFTADLSKADLAYTTDELRPHTDGTYSHDAPGLQMLHCLHFDGNGGETTMVDGLRIADELRRTDPQAFTTLSTVPIPGQYIGDGAHLIAARPVLRHDAAGNLVQVSFNNADRAPFMLPTEQTEAVYHALRAFDLLANDERFMWRHVLRPGEALLFDNWRVLHGRTAFTGRRTLCGAYLNHEDFESRLRLASA